MIGPPQLFVHGMPKLTACTQNKFELSATGAEGFQICAHVPPGPQHHREGVRCLLGGTGTR